MPKGTHRREEYLPGNTKIDDNGAGFMYYSDYSADLIIETFKNRVTLADYNPEATQDNLRCPQIKECCVHFSTRFDEYQRLPFSDEKRVWIIL